MKKQDKINSSKHHEKVQRTNKTDLLDQVSSRQEQISCYYNSRFCTTYIKANLIVLNFVQSEKYISDKDKYSTKEVTLTKKMNGDDLKIQRTDPNESNKYFDYDSIQRNGDDVSSHQRMVYQKFKCDQYILTSEYIFYLQFNT